MNETIVEILEKWLMENGYDGLFGDDCGCRIGDLMACGEPQIDCKAGYKVSSPDSSSDYQIGPKKEIADD